jgi:serine/threonine-protein kinase RsbW
MSDVVVRFSALPEHVRTARLVAAAVGRKNGLAEHILDEVRIAVGEACSRAVSAHLARRPDAPIELRLRDGDGVFEATISDEVPSEETADLAAQTEELGASTDGPSASPEGRSVTADASAPAEDFGAPSERLSATEDLSETADLTGTADSSEIADSSETADSSAPTEDVGVTNPETFKHVGSHPHLVPRQLPPGVGLAVVSALAREVDVSTSPAGVRVRMSWPTR